jgi:hypothetical protein
MSEHEPFISKTADSPTRQKAVLFVPGVGCVERQRVRITAISQARLYLLARRPVRPGTSVVISLKSFSLLILAIVRESFGDRPLTLGVEVLGSLGPFGMSAPIRRGGTVRLPCTTWARTNLR